MCHIMFRVKICGVTRTADALAAAASGADAIGLNFVASSPRRVTLEAASELADAVPPHVQVVGVFADHSVSDIARIADRIELSYVQIHGSEPASIAADLPRPYIRAVRIGETGDASLLRTVEAWSALATPPAAFLVDAFSLDAYGGTGLRADWNAARNLVDRFPNTPFVLAGGLTPDNVRVAIRQVQPAAVDVASGIESSPGVKDADRTKRFISEAIEAWR